MWGQVFGLRREDLKALRRRRRWRLFFLPSVFSKVDQEEEQGVKDEGNCGRWRHEEPEEAVPAVVAAGSADGGPDGEDDEAADGHGGEPETCGVDSGCVRICEDVGGGA